MRILDDDAPGLSALLEQIPSDVDMVDATDEQVGADSPATKLWQQLEDYHGIGWVTANKLVARKRPRLLPVYDSHILRTVMGGVVGGGFWRSLRDGLAADERALHKRLINLRERAGIRDDISAIRVFDVVCWVDAARGGKQAPQELIDPA